MEQGYTRKKMPELVRRTLLECAAQLAMEKGLAFVTVQAVADAAGVTKGGLIHHFPSKQALIEAVFQGLLSRLDDELDRLMAADPEPGGAFTRAYLNAVLDMELDGIGSPWASLSISMLTDTALRDLWGQWFERRLKRHRSTDDGVAFETVRLAADGIWLAGLAGVESPNRAQLREHLLAMTRKSD